MVSSAVLLLLLLLLLALLLLPLRFLEPAHDGLCSAVSSLPLQSPTLLLLELEHLPLDDPAWLLPLLAGDRVTLEETATALLGDRERER